MTGRLKKRFTGDIWLDPIIYFIATVIFIATLYPFLNVLALSFNESSDSLKGGVYIWPRVFTLRNYAKIFEYKDLMTGFINTVLRTVIGTTLSLIFTSMTAFVLSRRDFFLRKLATVMFTTTMYVSGGLVPTYLLMRQLHLMNNFLVYIIPGLLWVYCVILMRTYIDSLPISLQESAVIDGANDFYIYLRIIMPLCLPSLATVLLFYAVGNWNDWFTAYLYTSGRKDLTLLQFELQKILQDSNAAANFSPDLDMRSRIAEVTPKSVQMAVTVVVTVPIIMVYPFIQKYFIKGMTIGAIKG